MVIAATIASASIDVIIVVVMLLLPYLSLSSSLLITHLSKLVPYL
jgi:hypothetical protein